MIPDTLSQQRPSLRDVQRQIDRDPGRYAHRLLEADLTYRGELSQREADFVRGVMEGYVEDGWQSIFAAPESGRGDQISLIIANPTNAGKVRKVQTPHFLREPYKSDARPTWLNGMWTLDEEEQRHTHLDRLLAELDTNMQISQVVVGFDNDVRHRRTLLPRRRFYTDVAYLIIRVSRIEMLKASTENELSRLEARHTKRMQRLTKEFDERRKELKEESRFLESRLNPDPKPLFSLREPSDSVPLT